MGLTVYSDDPFTLSKAVGANTLIDADVSIQPHV